MTTMTKRLLGFQTRKGQSLYDLMVESTEETACLFKALKRLHTIALDVFDADGEQFDAMEEAINALDKAGDPEAIAANIEWLAEKHRLGLPT